jgi:hypothetical protein
MTQFASAFVLIPLRTFTGHFSAPQPPTMLYHQLPS